MTTLATSESEELGVQSGEVLELPLGILGFEQNKRYALLANPEEAPFLWLQMIDAPRHSFLVIPPAEVVPNYHPDLSEEDVDFLNLANPEDAFVVNIVTLRATGNATVNLKGPIVLNRRTRTAKQVIPLNVGQFPLQHPLPSVG